MISRFSCGTWWSGYKLRQKREQHIFSHLLYIFFFERQTDSMAAAKGILKLDMEFLLVANVLRTKGFSVCMKNGSNIFKIFFCTSCLKMKRQNRTLIMLFILLMMKLKCLFQNCRRKKKKKLLRDNIGILMSNDYRNLIYTLPETDSLKIFSN